MARLFHRRNTQQIDIPIAAPGSRVAPCQAQEPDGPSDHGARKGRVVEFLGLKGIKARLQLLDKPGLITRCLECGGGGLMHFDVVGVEIATLGIESHDHLGADAADQEGDFLGHILKGCLKQAKGVVVGRAVFPCPSHDNRENAPPAKSRWAGRAHISSRVRRSAGCVIACQKGRVYIAGFASGRRRHNGPPSGCGNSDRMVPEGPKDSSSGWAKAIISRFWEVVFFKLMDCTDRYLLLICSLISITSVCSTRKPCVSQTDSMV